MVLDVFNCLKDYYGLGILISGDLLLSGVFLRQEVPAQPAKYHGPPNFMVFHCWQQQWGTVGVVSVRSGEGWPMLDRVGRVSFEGLPLEQWKAGGGRSHREEVMD